MQCHACGRAVEADDRFCNGCGAALTTADEATAGEATTGEPTEAIPTVADASDQGATEPDPPATRPDGATPDRLATEQLPRTELVEQVPAEDWGDDDPVWAATGAVPVTSAEPTPVATGQLPQTQPITEVWMDRVDQDPATAVPTSAVPATAQMPAAQIVTAPRSDHRFRFSAVTFLGLLGGVALLVGMFATVVEVTSNARITIGDDAPAAFRLGTWIADDLGDNLSIAGLVAALLMVVGGVGASFGLRWGSGLAGGGGLAAAGLAALVIGLAQYPIDAAHEFAAIPSDEQFTLTITKALGYWLLVAAGAIGIVVFFASTNDAFRDHPGGLNPWIAALGALAVVVAAAGPLIPEDLGVFSDNWYVVERPGEPPAMLVAMRLVQLGLLALGGVIGFLSVRRWGLGVAAGATLPAIWLGVSTLFELGDSPVGPGFRNPGATDTALHGVTIIGLSATLAMLILAVVAAYDQAARR